jgi:hypothetical protein
MLPSNFIHHTSASNCKTSPRIVYSEALSLHNEKNDQLSKFSSKGDSSPTRQISNLSDQMQTLEILDFCQRMPSLHKTTKTVANSK